MGDASGAGSTSPGDAAADVPVDADADVDADVAVVGAGAAGLMTAIVAARERPGIRVALLDGQVRPGAKILASGGGRCNVTNRVVRPADFHGDRAFIAKVLGRFGAERTVAFFEEIGVALKHEPEFDKLFPTTDDAATVLSALVRECGRLGCPVLGGRRVTAVDARTVASAATAGIDAAAVGGADGFVVRTSQGDVRAARVVLATGGRSLPRTGSDGAGYGLARALGHTVTPTVPALVPLLIDPHPLRGLEGIAFPVELRVLDGERVVAKAAGPMLVTHFGVSGPAALDISRHWSVAADAGRRLALRMSLFPGLAPQALEQVWLEEIRTHGRRPAGALVEEFPRRVAERLLGVARVAPERKLGDLSRDERARLVAACTALDLPVRDTRGFNAAEVTAGGVPTSEVDPRTMESRVRRGLHLVGEILDVEGRLGGFNFQWAWATGFVCGQAVAAPRR